MLQRTPRLINKAFNQYLFASLLTVAATQIANIVDAAIVGNLMGADGLAAVNLSKPLLQAFFAVTCLYVASSTILAGMAIGGGNKEVANKLFSFSVAVSLFLGILFSGFGLLFFNPLSSLLCQSDTLRPLSDAFMRITLLSALPQLLMLTLHQFVTVDGNPKLVSRAVIVGNVANILLDIVFIKYCSMGIAGAATATCVMYIVCIVMVLPHFRKKGSLRLSGFGRLGVWSFSCLVSPNAKQQLDKIFSIGLPLFLSTVLLSVQYIGNNYVASRYLGDDGLVALAICIQLLAFSMIILTGTLRTIQPVGSILKGLEDNRGLLMLMKRGYGFMTVCFAIFTAILVFFPSEIGILLGVHEGSGLDMVRKALPAFSLNIVFQGMLCFLLPAFQLYGRKGMALLLSIAQSLLPMIFFLLLQGSWIGFFVGQVVTGVIILGWGVVVRRRDRSLFPILLIPLKDKSEEFDITVRPTTQSLSEAIESLRTFLSSKNIKAHTVNTAAVCTEEFVLNIIRHSNASSIDLSVNLTSDYVNIMIHDDGIAFNPVDTIKSSETKIGLGLVLAQSFCKDIEYKYLFNQNMVRIRV